MKIVRFIELLIIIEYVIFTQWRQILFNLPFEFQFANWNEFDVIRWKSCILYLLIGSIGLSLVLGGKSI